MPHSGFSGSRERSQGATVELIDGGPKVPVRLLNELDRGNVVFFCGAGVSMGPESGLPDFDSLTEHVYLEHGVEPETLERQAHRQGELDTVLDLLEARRLPNTVRKTVAKRLSEPPPKGYDELCVHKALLDLSRKRWNHKLVPTIPDSE